MVGVDDHVDPTVVVVMTLALDCRAWWYPSDEHDAAAAAVVSHLPHLLAEALAVTAAEVPLPLRVGCRVFPRCHQLAYHSDLVRAMCELTPANWRRPRT